MNYEGKISKVILAGIAVILLFVYSIMYTLDIPMSAVNQVYLVAGTLSMWLAMMLFPQLASTREETEHSQKLSTLENIISVTGLLGIVILLCVGIVVLMMPLILNTEMSTDSYIRLQDSAHNFFAIDVALIIYMVISMNIWSKFEVKNGHLVLLGSKLLYPGEKYRMWPFMTYKARVIDAEFLVKTETIDVKCKNDSIPVKVSSFMKINIEETKKHGITSIDPKKLSEEAAGSLVHILKIQASSINVSELLKGNLKAETLEVAGIPIIWEGRVQISTT